MARNIFRGVRYQDEPTQEPRKLGSTLGSMFSNMLSRRDRMQAKKAAIREDKRAERKGFAEQIPQDKQPVFETEARDISSTGFSAQALDDNARANLPQAMDMSRMVQNIDVSDPNQVMAFQQAFNDMGGNLKIDGKFGPNTLSALRRAQGAAQPTNSRMEAVDAGNPTSPEQIVNTLDERQYYGPNQGIDIFGNFKATEEDDIVNALQGRFVR